MSNRLAVVAVGGIVLAVRGPAGHAPMADPAVRRKYWTIVAVEFGLIAVGALILGATGAADWISVWVCAVVGVHFVPLAGVFGAEPLKVVGIVLVVAAVALFLGLATSVPPVTVTGAGAGLVLLVSGALGLVAGGAHLIPTRIRRG
ncbi:hypothetical protein [Rhodococcus sp. NPDC058521]|uniref:hypothetical protein n=1 Tax=Rhodococcus sp. NPDC058521 TaxID=3346536 RepID=UPI00365F7506